MTYVKSVEEAMAFILDDVKRSRAKLAGELPKPMKFEPYRVNVGLLSYDLKYVDNKGEYITSSWNNPHENLNEEKIIARRDSLLAVLDRLSTEANAVEQRNLVVAAHNLKITNKVKLMMNELGIPDKYSETTYKRNKPVANWVSAGYMGDLQRNVPISYPRSGFDAQIKAKRERILKWASDALAELREQAKTIRMAEHARKRENFLATMRARYNLNYEADESEIFNAIIDRSPYLKLAHGLMRNRKDWSEGPYYAKIALSRFILRNPVDEEVRNDIQSKIDDWGGDGRVFMHGGGGVLRVLNLAAEEDAIAVQDYNAYGELFDKE